MKIHNAYVYLIHMYILHTHTWSEALRSKIVSLTN